MKKLIIGLFVLYVYSAIGQTTIQPHIFNDTSLYFIKQFNGGNPVELSADDLALAEQLLLQALKNLTSPNNDMLIPLIPKRKKEKHML